MPSNEFTIVNNVIKSSRLRRSVSRDKRSRLLIYRIKPNLWFQE